MDQETLSTYLQRVETSLEETLLNEQVKSRISLYTHVCEGFVGKGLGMRILLSHYYIEKYVAIDKNIKSITRVLEENPAFRPRVLPIEGDLFHESTIQACSPYMKNSLFLMIGQLHHLQDREFLHLIKNVPADRFLILERCMDENLGEDVHNYMLLHRFEEILQRIKKEPVETLRYLYEYTSLFESNNITIELAKNVERGPFCLPDPIVTQYIDSINGEIDSIEGESIREALKKELSFLIKKIDRKMTFPPLYVMILKI
ncbi:MAG: hypothetical protein HXS44_14570 [Theionarchaea archaeon]|nr:hypothetical protein [Theionarchaea archaeon]